jgi:hypothetical protein
MSLLLSRAPRYFPLQWRPGSPIGHAPLQLPGTFLEDVPSGRCTSLARGLCCGRCLDHERVGEMDNTTNYVRPPVDQQPISVGGVAKIIRRRPWVIILCRSIWRVPLLSLVCYDPPVYVASATLLVGKKQGQVGSPAKVDSESIHRVVKGQRTSRCCTRDATRSWPVRRLIRW